MHLLNDNPQWTEDAKGELRHRIPFSVTSAKLKTGPFKLELICESLEFSYSPHIFSIKNAMHFVKFRYLCHLLLFT